MAVIDVTLNPNDMGTGFSLSNRNLTVTSTTNLQAIRATHGRSSGKWYWEVKLDVGARHVHIGVANKIFTLINFNVNDTNWRVYYGNTGGTYPGGATYGVAWNVGEVVGVALDLEIGTLEFYRNGLSMGISHRNIKELGEVYPLLGSNTPNTKTLTVNFGGSPFVYNVPIGFSPYDREIVNKTLLLTSNGVYSLKDSSAYKLNTDSEKNYLSYGADSITSFNGYLTKMKDIKNTSSVLGLGKTFEHSVDMSKRRVDKIVLG